MAKLPAHSDVLIMHRNLVYVIQAEADGAWIKFHVAVRRDDLHTFVTFADIPCGGALHCSMVRGALLQCVGQTNIVDWERERVLFGETPWLIWRQWPDWRAIRRLDVSECDGTVREGGWFPPEVAEPVLRMLENSVSAPNTLWDAPA